MKKKKSVNKKRFRLMLQETNLITIKDIKKKYNCKTIRETKKGNKFVLIQQRL